MKSSSRLAFYFAPLAATLLLLALLAATVAAWKVAVPAAAVGLVLLLLGSNRLSAQGGVAERWQYFGLFAYSARWLSLMLPLIMIVDQTWRIEGLVWLVVALAGILGGRLAMKRGPSGSTAA